MSTRRPPFFSVDTEKVRPGGRLPCSLRYVPRPGRCHSLACRVGAGLRRRVLLMSRPGVDLARFWGQVAKDNGEDGCWIWTGATSKPSPSAAEYGKYAGRGVAHRVAYKLLVGPIPEGLELDHLCRVTLCVNPAHLEPVTRAENMRRRVAALTHCKYGHELTPENCMGDTKVCLTCKRARANERYYRVIRPNLDIGRRDRECIHGHPTTPENTYVTPAGHRHCRVCKRQREAEYRAAKRRKAIETRARRAA